MNHCAKECLQRFGDIILGYGESDEFSFVIKKSSSLYGRRARLAENRSCIKTLTSNGA